MIDIFHRRYAFLALIIVSWRFICPALVRVCTEGVVKCMIK